MRIPRGAKKNDPRIYHHAKDKKDALVKVMACGGEIGKLNLLLTRAAYQNDLLTATVALENGADPNSQNRLSEGAWENACQKGSVEMVRLFVEHGASLGTDKFGTPPLIHAIQNCREDVVRELIKAGANVNERDNNTLYTPLHVATVRPKCINTMADLIEAGADPRMEAGNGCDVMTHAERYNERFGGVDPRVFKVLQSALNKWKGKPLPKKPRRKPKSELQKQAMEIYLAKERLG